MDKRRKINGQDSPFPIQHNNEQNDFIVEQNDTDFLALSLSLTHYTVIQPPPPSPPQLPLKRPSPDDGVNSAPLANAASGPSHPRRARRNPSRTPREGKSDTVPVPFPWATDRRATVHTLDHLVSNRITTISGDVACKKCDRHFTMEFDLNQKFTEIGNFVMENKESMRQRAAKDWQTPKLPKCRYCDQENSVRPVISEKKKAINWLFMLLGQTLGCCTLDQLKYFCKHTKNHRTGAKDRVLYLTYLALCKQLNPQGPFDP